MHTGGGGSGECTPGGCLDECTQGGGAQVNAHTYTHTCTYIVVHMPLRVHMHSHTCTHTLVHVPTHAQKLTCRIVQKRMYTLYMTACLVKMPYIQ